MTEFFLIHRDVHFVELVKEALAQAPDCVLIGQATTGKEALFYLPTTPAKAVLVQLAQPDMDGFELIRQIAEKFPDLYIVPILEGNETGDIWFQILQRNLRDVISGKMDSASIINVLKNASKRAEEIVRDPNAARGKSYMIAVAGARSGTGKSIFATNLIISMAKLKAQTTLIDYSMCAGDFFTMLDFVPRNTLAEAIAQGGELDNKFLNSLISDHPSGFKFLACPNQDFDYYSFTYEMARNLLQIARQVTPYTVIDAGAPDLPTTLAALDEADLVFLITNRDLSRLLSLQRYIKFLVTRNILPEKLKVIVNNAEIGTEISETEIETILEHPVAAYLPSCPLQTTFSINSGKPLANHKTDIPFCKVIHRLSELCINHWREE